VCIKLNLDHEFGQGEAFNIKPGAGCKPAGVERKLAARALSVAEREEISRGLATGQSYRSIYRIGPCAIDYQPRGQS
jgi:hypothetical protein